MPDLPVRLTVQTHQHLPRPLKMGGTNPQGSAIQVNQRFLTLNQRPWLPVMGEFHYSRYPVERWEEEVLKMKAGGVTVIAAYVFWIHHEEIEGQFDWSGSRDVRRLVQACQKHGLLAYPRIGPWAHGECRSGGFPDWLLERCGKNIRQDSQPYLSYVLRLYTEIARQLSGLLWKDGGPVIGIQLENELIHNAPHIKTLKDLALQVGLDVPFYTMTGWGPADVPAGEVIPVFGGYPDAFWDRQVETWSRPSIKHYFFSPVRDDNAIGADLHPRSDVNDLAYLEEYPFGTCETGGGMQVSYHRRPLIQAEDVASLAMVKVGSGSNLQGYYMYHGGANPSGKLSTLQESQATGYPNDLPVINYDFQAPLGQYGQARGSYHALRLLHLFLHDFGDRLAPLPMHMPQTTANHLDDRQTLRWCVRSDGDQGYLFINNYQRVEQLPAHAGVQFAVDLTDETLVLPSHPLDIPSGLFTFWPLTFAMDGALLKFATAQPVCRLPLPSGPCCVFCAPDGIESEFLFSAENITSVDTPGQHVTAGGLLRLSGLVPGPGCLVRLTLTSGSMVSILLLDTASARQLYKLHLWGQDRLCLCDGVLYTDGETLHVQSTAPQTRFAIFPAPAGPLSAQGRTLVAEVSGVFTWFQTPAAPEQIQPEVRRSQPGEPARPVVIGPAGVAQPPDEDAYAAAETWLVTVPPSAMDGRHEVLLIVDYIGDCARASLGGQLVDDHFYYGLPWEIGLSRFDPALLQDGLTLRFIPLRRDAPIYLPPEARPDFANAPDFLQVRSIQVKTVSDTAVTLADNHSAPVVQGAA